MSKSITNQRQIYKNSSSRFRDVDYNLNLDIEVAKRNNELVSISDGIGLRIIRRLIGMNYTEEDIDRVKEQIKILKKKKNTLTNRNKIKKLYKELSKMTFIPQINSIVFESMKDWDKANRKTKKYKLNKTDRIRTIGTTGGVKKNTVLFTDKKIHGELEKKLNNGMNPNARCVPAKFEAYKALAFSGSTPVTQPRGVIVIKDAEIEVMDDVLLLSDDGLGGFNLTPKKNYKIKHAFCDGCGMMSESYAKQIAIDLGEYKEIDGEKVAKYTPSGANFRNFSCKGMAFTFPFVEAVEEFIEKNGASYFIEDAWGDIRDVREADMIITTNMLKLWYAYDSYEHYEKCCEENWFEYCVAKLLPEELEETRNMNYQFLESYKLNDNEIGELIKPTVDSIKGAISEDYIKMILFLKGINITEKDFLKDELDYLRALMIDERMSKDPFIRQKVYKMIQKKINDAKKGVVECRGSYEIVSGDLFGLCQHMCGLPVTGILKAGEFHSNTWNSRGVNEIVAFRAPMTVHNNIKKMKLINNEKTQKWYKFMKTCLIVNAFDTTMEAMNGEDFDKLFVPHK